MHKDAGPPPAQTTTLAPSSLRTLQIDGLHSMDDELLSDFLFKGLTSLKKLDIRDCPKLTSFLHIPEKMTSVREMSILNCKNLISCCCPPALTRLEISGCDGMRSLCIGSRGLLSLQHFMLSGCPSLSSLLKIDSCPNLKDPPPAETTTLPPPSLRMLVIQGLDSMDDELLSDFLFKGLEKLDIHDCPKLTSFLHIPEKMTSLREMTIDNCKNLISCCCPPALTSLKISGCAGMTSLCIGSPDSSVGSLNIHNCPNFRKEQNNTSACVEKLRIHICGEEQLAGLLSHAILAAKLKKLHIDDCFDIESFGSTALLQLNSLVSLKIERCPNLKSLPPVMSSSGSGLLSLQQIGISHCRMLSILPDLRPLTALRRLYIIDCPMLEDKYEETKDNAGNNVNPYWDEICHIPDVQFKPW